MPLNTLRLNHAASKHPNDRIVFFKPLPRPPSEKEAYDTAGTFLRAIAAQCLPIMKKHYLSVTTLAEHEPNREFIGRNFNNGEIIELVLRTKSGGWVSFQVVQMVMMHELAHNIHMNHSKSFWQTRNLFSTEMKELWTKQYTGEGFWGGGRTLGNLSSIMGNNIVPSEELQDIEVCGGIYRSRRIKRKPAGPELTWKEKRERRIEKKFGMNGQSLGEDEDQRLRLEIGRKGPIGAKPRVAGSKRGRELRAAAALARFSPNKREVQELARASQADEDHADESEEDEYEEAEEPGEDALDFSGQKLLDSKGNGMIRVCGDEDGTRDEVQVKRELEELEGLETEFTLCQRNRQQAPEDEEHLYKGASTSQPPQKAISDTQVTPPQLRLKSSTTRKPATKLVTTNKDQSTQTVECQICSLRNDHLSSTCLACGHVLDKAEVPNGWSCSSEACKGSLYVNAGDCGLCGLCGSSRVWGND